MLFLVVHYWEVMVNVWPAIVKVLFLSRHSLNKGLFIFYEVGGAGGIGGVTKKKRL